MVRIGLVKTRRQDLEGPLRQTFAIDVIGDISTHVPLPSTRLPFGGQMTVNDHANVHDFGGERHRYNPLFFLASNHPANFQNFPLFQTWLNRNIQNGGSKMAVECAKKSEFRIVNCADHKIFILFIISRWSTVNYFWKPVQSEWRI